MDDQTEIAPRPAFSDGPPQAGHSQHLAVAQPRGQSKREPLRREAAPFSVTPWTIGASRPPAFKARPRKSELQFDRASPTGFFRNEGEFGLEIERFRGRRSMGNRLRCSRRPSGFRLRRTTASLGEIIVPAFRSVGEHLVRFRHQFEEFDRPLVVGVKVGMVFLGQVSKGRVDLRGSCRAWQAQNRVVVFHSFASRILGGQHLASVPRRTPDAEVLWTPFYSTGCFGRREVARYLSESACQNDDPRLSIWQEHTTVACRGTHGYRFQA